MIDTLIVENDPMVLELNKQYLIKIDGFKLVDATLDIDMAKKILNSKKVDLVLLDTCIMNGDGFKLLNYIKKINLDIDIILITAASDVISIKKAIRYGVYDYLIKPFTFKRFLNSLESFKNMKMLLKNKQNINQEELDIIFQKAKSNKKYKILPKGLTKFTLKKLMYEIETLDSKYFSTEEIALLVGISRVSISKYLNFLLDIGVLELNMNYGTIGRPIAKYKYNIENNYILDQYLD